MASGNCALVTRKVDIFFWWSSRTSSLILGYMMGSPTKDSAQCWAFIPSASLSAWTPGTPTGETKVELNTGVHNTKGRCGHVCVHVCVCVCVCVCVYAGLGGVISHTPLVYTRYLSTCSHTTPQGLDRCQTYACTKPYAKHACGTVHCT